MSNSFLQLAYTSNRRLEGVDVDEVFLKGVSNVRLKNVKANRIVIARECRDVEIDGFRLSGKYSMPLVAQDPAYSFQGLHLCNGYVDCSESPDVEGDLQAISFRAQVLEDISIHDIWINNHLRNALAMYKPLASRWKNIDVHHLYVTNGRNVSQSATAGGIHFGSDRDPGVPVENCRVHDCLIRDTEGFGIRRKDYGVAVSNIISVNPNDLNGADNIMSGECAEDIRVRIISRVPV